MAGIVPESWLEWGLGAEGDLPPRPPEVDMLAAHDAVTTNSRKPQQKVGKLVNQGRHAAHAALLEELPETARPPRQGHPMGGTETKAFPKARYRSLQGAGATACFRARPTDLPHVIPAAEFVGMGRRFMGIGEHVAVRCPCSNALDVDTRRAHLPQSRGAGETAPAAVHAMSRTLKRRGIRHQVESGEPFTADRNLRMGICRQEWRSPGHS